MLNWDDRESMNDGPTEMRWIALAVEAHYWKADLRFALTRCWSGATVCVVKPGGGLPTRSTASGMGLRIPAVDLWTTRLCFMRGLGTSASTGCYREPWRLES